MQNVIIDGGLDLATARPATLPGRIRDCLNYESGWRRGNTRIDGFERFDGHTSPSTTTGWVFNVFDTGIIDGPFTAPETCTWSNDNATGPAGTLVQTGVTPPPAGELPPLPDATQFWLVFQSGQRRPQYGDTITGDESGASFTMSDLLTDEVYPDGIQTFPQHYGTHSAYLDGLDGLATIMRDEVQPVPGSGTIVGLHYHEDQLYALRDVTRITIAAAGANRLVPGMYVINANNAEVGEVLAVDATGLVIDILPVDAVDGFSVTPGDPVDICLSIRFELGTGEIPEFAAGRFVTSNRLGPLVHYETRDGSFDSDNALGVAVYAHVSGDPTLMIIAALIHLGDDPAALPVTATMTIESIMFVDEFNVATAESVSSQSDVAAMWRSTDSGWEQATTGRQLGFYDGQHDPAGASVPGDKTLPPNVAEFYEEGGSPVSTPWSTPYTDILVDDASESDCFPATVFHVAHNSDWLEISDFKFALSDTYTVTGMEVNFKGQNTAATGSSTYCSFQAKLLGSDAELYSVPVHFGGGVPDYTVPAGGDGLPWQEDELTPELLNSADFGFQIRATNNAPNNWGSHVELNYVTVKVYYDVPPGERVYLFNGNVDIGWVQVASAVVSEGTWGGDPAAEGYLRVTDWSIVEIPAGISLQTEVSPGVGVGGGTYIGKTTGALSLPTLPGSLLLDENVSKYEMISYNFFASEDRNAIYGVNGAGLAFWYDGETLDFIPTGVGLDKDKPRHIAPHENRLALGYIWGEVYLSGTDPINFIDEDQGVLLTASFGFGDKITGLMPAPGKALAVFTESTTNVLIGAPESFGEEALSGTVQQQIVNHKVGAIEYTVQSMGNAPIFASFRGIETLETMDQYSDFFTAPLTHDVSSWLLERLQTAAGVEAVNKAVVNSVVVRNKNQYRLFFADGYLMTLTFMGKERDPQLTIQQYWFQDDRTKFARCYATASGVTTDGRDRAFFSVVERTSTVEETVIGDNLNYVYELDRGRSFDGYDIEAYFDLTHYYSQSRQGGPAPERAHRFNNFQLHGVCAGTADMHVSRSINYEDLDDPVMGNEPIPFYAGGKPAEDTQKPKYTKGRLNGRGFAVSMHVSHKSKLEFPHTVQMVTFLNDSDLREDR